MTPTSMICACLLSIMCIGEVRPYAKMSRNGQELGETRNGQQQQQQQEQEYSWIGRLSNASESEGRSVKNIAITMSPVYVPPRTPNLQNGEAIDYPSTRRYSTLDRELIARLDHKQIQDRYHPHPLTFNSKPTPNGDNNDADAVVPKPRPSSPAMESDSYDFPGPYAPDYKPPDYTKSKPAGKPPTMMIGEYASPPIDEKPSDQPYYTGHDHQPDYPDYPGDDGSYNMADHPPKPIEFSIAPVDRPTTGDRPYDPKYHHHHHPPPPHEELIYDHVPPDYHDHYHHDHHHYQPETTTEQQPDMNDQRLDKRPYSYYFIGKKLWYVPLYFSIYFIIYIAALVLKSIARHKITFPEHLAQAVNHSRNRADSTWWEYTERVLEGIENFAEKFGRVS